MMRKTCCVVAASILGSASALLTFDSGSPAKTPSPHTAPPRCIEDEMNIKATLQTLVQEAELYLTQGLLRDAHERYLKVITLLEKQEGLRNREALIEKVRSKLTQIETKIEQLEGSPLTPQISRQAQDLIKKLFIDKEQQQDPETQMLEGAIVLARFGQYERALEEFGHLISKPELCIPAAKNILRCHLAVAEPQVAIEQYERWRTSSELSDDALEKVRFFLAALLKKRGLAVQLAKREALPTPPAPVESPAAAAAAPNAAADAAPAQEEPDEEMLDINSVLIAFAAGPLAGRKIELDVSFQSGNTISLLIPGTERDLVASLSEETQLNDVQFYSPIAIFQGQAWVKKCSRITSGPKNGSFNIDLRVASV
jgi:tetratricopeptide (TPR) repeat protein